MNPNIVCKVCGKKAIEDSHFYIKKQLCNKHYIQMYRYGKILTEKELGGSKIPHKCDICGDTESCQYRRWNKEGKYKNKIVCSKHYMQLLKNNGVIQDNLPMCRVSRICRVCGSTNRVIYSKKFGGLFCQRHYNQLYKLGELKEITIFDRNEYVINGNEVEIILRDGKNKESGRVLIDLEDLDSVIKHKWCIDTWGYPETKINGNSISMQRFILNKYDKNYIVDHINRNPLDNRKSNLRIATKSENAINSPIRSNNKSGVTGVIWNKSNEKWRAYITKNNKRYELGSFKDFDKAVKTRLIAEKKYFGEFAPQKHLYTEYGIDE